jgi:putative transcriptional regulator
MRTTRHRTEDSLAGSLLLAHPAMRDPNFRRTVVLMSAHDAEGAMGVVLNRPLGQRLGEVQGEFALGGLAAVPLFSGGPVQVDRLLLVVWQTRSDGFRLHFGIEPERAEQWLAEPGSHVRAFLGYSGWSAGQLEGELGQSTWVVVQPPADLFAQPGDLGLWRSVLGREGDEWRLLAGEPDDPANN